MEASCPDSGTQQAEGRGRSRGESCPSRPRLCLSAQTPSPSHKLTLSPCNPSSFPMRETLRTILDLNFNASILPSVHTTCPHHITSILLFDTVTIWLFTLNRIYKFGPLISLISFKYSILTCAKWLQYWGSTEQNICVTSTSSIGQFCVEAREANSRMNVML